MNILKFSFKTIVLCSIIGFLYGSNNRVIKLPEGLGNDEVLNIEEIEILTQEPFSKLIEEYTNLGRKFLLSRVITQQKGKYYAHYYDAHSLNQYLFGPYPIREENRLSLAFFNRNNARLYKNPLNKLPIYLVQYFSINNIKEKEFKYFCDHREH